MASAPGTAPAARARARQRRGIGARDPSVPRTKPRPRCGRTCAGRAGGGRPAKPARTGRARGWSSWAVAPEPLRSGAALAHGPSPRRRHRAHAESARRQREASPSRHWSACCHASASSTGGVPWCWSSPQNPIAVMSCSDSRNVGIPASPGPIAAVVGSMTIQLRDSSDIGLLECDDPPALRPKALNGTRVPRVGSGAWPGLVRGSNPAPASAPSHRFHRATVPRVDSGATAPVAPAPGEAIAPASGPVSEPQGLSTARAMSTAPSATSQNGDFDGPPTGAGDRSITRRDRRVEPPRVPTISLLATSVSTTVPVCRM